MAVREQYALRRFVGGICVEHLQWSEEFTTGMAVKWARSYTLGLKSPAKRQNSIVQLVRLDKGDWGRVDTVVIGAWRWSGGRVVHL